MDLLDEQPGHVTAPPPDGPPPPPWERRRGRRRVGLAVVLVLAVLGIGVALAIPGPRSEQPADAPVTPADPDAGEEADPDDDPATQPETLAPDEEGLAHPDPDALSGEDAAFGRLLIDIDASERTMIGFQDEVEQAFSEFPLPEGDLLDRVGDAAATGARGLLAVRERLAGPLDPPGAEAVRAVYVDHLDAWVRYLQAVEEEPALLDPSVDTSRYILAINASAGAFARALEEHLPADVDPTVRELADGILDRGFRRDTEPQV